MTQKAQNSWFLMLALTLLFACGTKPSPSGPQPTKPTATSLSPVRIGSALLHLEVAADFESRGRGLAGRSSLPADGGMIFVYQESSSRHFWMQGCLIGLDIAFVGADQKIIAVHSLPAPGPETTDKTMPRAACEEPVRFVVETTRGFMAQHGLGAGDRVEIPDELVKLAGLGAQHD